MLRSDPRRGHTTSVMAYQSYQYPDPMSWFITNGGLIDPGLDEQSATSHGTDPWTHQKLSRSLMDLGKPTYQSHAHLDSIFIGNGIRQPHGTTPLPSALLPRQGSPSDHPSSTCSALSPRDGSDYSLDYSPATPQDDMNMSPYTAPYEVWGQQAHQLTGLTSECVKPGDVSFSQDPILSYSQNNNPEFPPRGFSMSSNGSGYDFERDTRPESIQIQRQMSPTEMPNDIKDEIHIPDMVKSESYPPLESEDDAGTSEEEIEVAQIQEEDDDEEYKPSKANKPANKRANSNANRNSRNRKRPSASQHTSQVKKIKLEPINAAESRASANSSTQGVRASYPCSECRDIIFKDESGLQKHIKQKHSRPFTCIFNFAGCESTFASKNEWKRHVASQHLLLNYWLCQQDSCAKLYNGSSTTSKTTGTSRGRAHVPPQQSHGVSILPNGAIFNRKDLYTQHLRRMHTPPTIKKQVKLKKPVSEWEERIRTHQEEAHKARCDLPEYMECPVISCDVQFNGANAWDDRMEHVAKHLEKAATGSESAVIFGGENDPTLLNWAARPDVAVVKRDARGNWKQHNPLKPDKNIKPHTAVYGDEDAEGEEVDD